MINIFRPRLIGIRSVQKILCLGPHSGNDKPVNGETEWRIFKCNKFEELLRSLLGAAVGDNGTPLFTVEVDRQILVGVGWVRRQMRGIIKSFSSEGARFNNSDLCMNFQN
jgi:hypothetical protein